MTHKRKFGFEQAQQLASAEALCVSLSLAEGQVTHDPISHLTALALTSTLLLLSHQQVDKLSCKEGIGMHDTLSHHTLILLFMMAFLKLLWHNV